ncbi:MAG: helicase-related protein [Myxococcota bacterium]
MSDLPIQQLATAFETARESGPVVITSPTGSGKSTQVPRWCASYGPVMVVQPRRIACRALAARVASLEGTPLGDRVGYVVRDERKAHDESAIVFVTTGIALRWVRSGAIDRFATVILDELHERSLDLDLLAALLARHPHLVAMSATMDGDRVAAHFGGQHLSAEGRTHPVDIVHPDRQPPVPELDGLPERVRTAIEQAPEEGDVLVFLPGKGEILRCEQALQKLPVDVRPLHGGLALSAQAKVFEPSARRKVVLATNVAETSLTVPGIRVVIDSGLERRARYHDGRGVLTLLAIGADAADQRAGRAGRMAPGTAIRLWRAGTRLVTATPPAIHRESLVPLVLGAAACGAPKLDLPWLDPPKDHAIEAARATLRGLGALDEDQGLTEVGATLFGLPLDPAPGRLLVEAKAAGPKALADAIDLVAALSVRRPLFGPQRPRDPDDDLRRPIPWPGHDLSGLELDGASGCDATALVRAVREGEPRRHELDGLALQEARTAANRLREAFGLKEPRPAFDRPGLARRLLVAWPGVAHVARRRKREVAWSNGGTELRLAKRSAVDESEPDAVLVLDVRAVARHRLEQQLWCSAAMPVPLAWLRAAGLGRDRLAGCSVQKGQAVANLERVYAGKVLDRTTSVPEGAVARQAVAELFVRGTIFNVREARRRVEARALWARLNDEALPPPLEDWVAAKLEDLGVESGADLVLLSEDDLLPDALPAWEQERLDKDFPRELDIGDAKYTIEYHPARMLMELHKTSGKRKALPPASYVPKVPGWRIDVIDKKVRRTLRGR